MSRATAKKPNHIKNQIRAPLSILKATTTTVLPMTAIMTTTATTTRMTTERKTVLQQ